MVKVKSDKPEQSTLKTAVKNVKQKLLTKQLKKAEIKISTETVTPEEKPVVPLTRGIVYLGHIPHGFFESQMHNYFKQFGKVTRVRLVRSKKTGRSRGYGYIEFQHSEVAEIAAQSMNNYLMSGRLLKATYIPPEKQHGGYFSGRQWSKQNYPRMAKRAQQNTQKNKNVDNKEEAALVMRGLDKLSNIEKKLEAAGVVYKITPVEVPVPVVTKRKAPADSLPSEPAGKKIKTKGSKEVAVKQNKKKIESKAAIVEKKEEEPKSHLSVAPKTKKPVVAPKTKQPVVAPKTKQPVVASKTKKTVPPKTKKPKARATVSKINSKRIIK